MVFSNYSALEAQRERLLASVALVLVAAEDSLPTHNNLDIFRILAASGAPAVTLRRVRDPLVMSISYLADKRSRQSAARYGLVLEVADRCVSI
jgi:hypothetical protein